MRFAPPDSAILEDFPRSPHPTPLAQPIRLASSQAKPVSGSHAPAWEQACPDGGGILTLQRHEALAAGAATTAFPRWSVGTSQKKGRRRRVGCAHRIGAVLVGTAYPTSPLDEYRAQGQRNERLPQCSQMSSHQAPLSPLDPALVGDRRGSLIRARISLISQPVRRARLSASCSRRLGSVSLR